MTSNKRWIGASCPATCGGGAQSLCLCSGSCRFLIRGGPAHMGSYFARL
jgi:hypothetical protein